MPDMALIDLYRENHVGVDRNVPHTYGLTTFLVEASFQATHCKQN
jgi:hypothetical protein